MDKTEQKQFREGMIPIYKKRNFVFYRHSTLLFPFLVLLKINRYF